MFARDIVQGNYYQVRIGMTIPDVRVEKIWIGVDKKKKKVTRYVCTLLESGEPLVVRTARAFRQESNMNQVMEAIESCKGNNGTID